MKEISLSHPRAYLSQLVNRVLPRTTKVRSLMVSFLWILRLRTFSLELATSINNLADVSDRAC